MIDISQDKKTNWKESILQKGMINIDIQKIKVSLDMLNKYLKNIYIFFKDNKNNSKMMLFVAFITTSIAIYFGIQLFKDIQYINAKTPELNYLKSYDLRVLQEDRLTQSIIKNTDTIKDFSDEDILTKSEIKKYTDYLNSLQIPYMYLLQYIYLPSLNVWKEKYTNKIDTNLIGIKFLEQNPFNDISLLQKRWDFFKNLGDNNESNDILDMKIGDFVEDEKWFFSMPITVSFVANSKRAFLLLADKLSMTSNKENISLINEFFYYLWNEIKRWKEEEIKGLTSEYIKVFWSWTTEDINQIDQDKLIGYNMYNRLFNNKKNILIDNGIIDKTIKSIISCNNEIDEICYYRFRERYRNIPSFWYLVGTEVSSNGADNLKRFIRELPPMFSIKEFEFDKIKSPTLSDTNNSKYQWKVTIEVYGRSASVEEVDEIALALGTKCLWENKMLTTQDSLTIIQSAIVRLSDISRVDKTYWDNLRELKTIVEMLDEEYPKISNYKKTIKLFELYRMLSDSGLCK